MALWGTGVWGTAKWTEQVGAMAATETGVDVFSGEGDVVVAGTMAATESTVDTFAAVGVVTIVGQMAAVEFVEEDDEEERTPGTYITIRVPEGLAWKAGAVAVRYVAPQATE